MRRYIATTLVALSLFSPLVAADRTDSMLSSLQFIETLFETQYAPGAWKSMHRGWDLRDQMELARIELLAWGSPNIKVYKNIVRQFFQSMHDYHVGVMFYSTESASLPFSLSYVQGHYVVSYVDAEQISKQFPFRVGDEILTVDGAPIAEVMAKFLPEEPSPTDYALGALMFTHRTGVAGMEVPHGAIAFTGRSPLGQVRSFRMQWEYEPEQIADLTQYKSLLPQAAKNPFFLPDGLLDKLMIHPYFAPWAKKLHKGEEQTIGARESFLPALGKQIWRTSEDSPFHAYLFETAGGKKVGYIRIPHYLGGAEESAAFEQIIKKFQQESRALVIDQLNNPGGSAFYMYRLLSMLSAKPLQVPMHRISLSPKEVMEAISLLPLLEEVSTDEQAQQLFGDEVTGYPIDLGFLRQFISYLQSVIDQWNEGKTLTDPLPLYGLSVLPPHAVHYTRPILVLVNELDFSCGDFFPSVLQDNQRAKIFGAKTAGAGGFVLGVSFPNALGLAGFSYTGSIAERASLLPLEDLGVTPDFPYELTFADVTAQYGDYRRAVLESIQKMVGK